ncbi:MAG: hypothetical protein V4508_26445 [Pseudomonadota bacterium]
MARLLILIILAACAAELPRPGDTADAVTARFGHPSATYPDGAGQELEFATGPMGQSTWMAHIGADGRLVNLEQVLTGPKFATIRVDLADKAAVLRTLGRPSERSRVALGDYEVWSYRYKENGVWNSMMHVHFDHAGIVRLMLNGPDPMYNEDKRGFR